MTIEGPVNSWEGGEDRLKNLDQWGQRSGAGQEGSVDSVGEQALHDWKRARKELRGIPATESRNEERAGYQRKYLEFRGEEESGLQQSSGARAFLQRLQCAAEAASGLPGVEEDRLDVLVEDNYQKWYYEFIRALRKRGFRRGISTNIEEWTQERVSRDEQEAAEKLKESEAEAEAVNLCEMMQWDRNLKADSSEAGASSSTTPTRATGMEALPYNSRDSSFAPPTTYQRSRKTERVARMPRITEEFVGVQGVQAYDLETDSGEDMTVGEPRNFMAPERLAALPQLTEFSGKKLRMWLKDVERFFICYGVSDAERVLG
ncbi:hypothetical protein Emag_007348 [Eimeria magna]